MPRADDIIHRVVRVGTAVKPPCRVATTANVSLTGLQTIGGVTQVAGDRTLVWKQSTASQNGIYLAGTGAWERAKDFDGDLDLVCGARVFVTSGTYAHYEFALTTDDPISIGDTNLTFAVMGVGDISKAFQVDTSAASFATGIKITSAAAGSGVSIAAISSGTNENLTIDAKGTGTISFGSVSTGASLFNAGTVSLPGISFGVDPDSGIYRIGADNIGIALNGVKVGDWATTGFSISGTGTITSASASALTVGRVGATNPALQVDASTASSATGLKIKSAAAAGGVALSAITSGTNESLTINAAAAGTIGIGTISTGNITLGNSSTAIVAVPGTTASTTTTTGAVTVAGGLGVAGDIFSANQSVTTAYKVGGTKVAGARVTGYAAMTGSPDKATSYDTATVTLAQLAGRVAQLQADLTTHGLIGA